MLLESGTSWCPAPASRLLLLPESLPLLRCRYVCTLFPDSFPIPVHKLDGLRTSKHPCTLGKERQRFPKVSSPRDGMTSRARLAPGFFWPTIHSQVPNQSSMDSRGKAMLSVDSTRVSLWMRVINDDDDAALGRVWQWQASRVFVRATSPNHRASSLGLSACVAISRPAPPRFNGHDLSQVP